MKVKIKIVRSLIIPAIVVALIMSWSFYKSRLNQSPSKFSEGTYEVSNLAAAETARKRVLILCSGSADMNWYQRIHRHVEQRIWEEIGPSEILMEYLGLLRDNTPEHRKMLGTLLRNKYTGQTFDLIINLNRFAMSFVREDLKLLFPDTPIVFGDNKTEVAEPVRSDPRITCVLSEKNKYRSEMTLKLALQLQPDTRQVVVVSGRDPHSQDYERRARKLFAKYQNRVRFTWLSGAPMREIIAKVSRLPSDAVVIFLFFLEDGDGNKFMPLESPQMVAEASTAPVYGLWDELIGLSLVGGHMNSAIANADRIADSSLRVLRGEAPSSIPYGRYKFQYMFDWRQLKRWSIPEDRLPLGSIVMFKELTAWERYKGQIIGIMALIVFQLLIIAYLLHQRTIRRRAERKLSKARDELEDRVAERTLDLAKAKEAAEAANGAKSVFLANMSHELRTPLNHIIGFTELIVDNRFGDLNTKQKKYMNNVLQSGQHLLSLVNDILDISKVESGKLEMQPVPVDLKHMMQNSLIMVKEKALKHGIRLSLDTGGIPESIMADERKLKQILYNLLANAVKFTPVGGSVNCIAIHSGSNGDIEVSVTDTGIGISAADLKRIFDPFEQVEGSISRRFQGTGLGLSLTKKLVELHGGKIWAESDGVGKGATFRFTIPTGKLSN